MLTKEETAKEKVAVKKHKAPRMQMTLSETLQCHQKYDNKSQRYQLITRKLAVYVGSTSAPISLVENEEFRSFMITLDPRYPVPSRTLIGREIDN